MKRLAACSSGRAGIWNACFESTYDALNRHVSTKTNSQLGNSVVPLWTDYFDALGRIVKRARVNLSDTHWGYAETSTDVTSMAQTFHSAPTIDTRYAYNRAHQVVSQNTTVPLAHPPAAGPTNLGGVDGSNRLFDARFGYEYGDIVIDRRPNHTYTYDNEDLGRLTAASYPGGSATYGYDPFGRRYSKTVNGVVTGFLHDEQGREIAEFDGNGALVRYWLYSAHSAAPVVSLGPDGYTGLAYPNPDRLGSVVSTSDGLGNYLNATAYLPYGESRTGAPPPGSPFGYAGYRYDAETGLYYVRNRTYDPRLGRFLTPDPIGQDGGMNLYAYVGNDPLNRTDPSGLCPQCIGAVLGLGVDLSVNYGDYRSAFVAGNYGEILARGGIAAGAGALGGFAGGKAVSITVQRFNTLGSGTAGAGLELAAGAVGNGFGNGVQQGTQILSGYRDTFSASDVGVAAAAGALGSNVAAGIRGAGQAIAVEANAMARTAADAISQLNGAVFGAGFDLLRKDSSTSPAPRPEFRPRISLDGGRS